MAPAIFCASWRMGRNEYGFGAQSNVTLVLSVKTRRLAGFGAVVKIRNEWDLTMGPHRTSIPN